MGKSGGYRPPNTITSQILTLVAEIGEIIGRYTALADEDLTPRLRRENRIRTIQASLVIENSTLTLEQVTAVIDGRRVLGHPREIQEVRNAFVAYEAMEEWEATSQEDLLAAHGLLMSTLVDDAGMYRTGGVGILRGKQLVHMAPPADQVTDQVSALMRAISLDELGTNDLMKALGLSHRPTFRENYINPALDGNWIERTHPDSPRSPIQRYRLTSKGQSWLRQHDQE